MFGVVGCGGVLGVVGGVVGCSVRQLDVVGLGFHKVGCVVV